jgi:hypothetical protein
MVKDECVMCTTVAYVLSSSSAAVTETCHFIGTTKTNSAYLKHRRTTWSAALSYDMLEALLFLHM